MKQPDQAAQSLEIYLPVHNIGREQARGLRQALTHPRGKRKPEVNAKDVRRVLRPVETPRANITFPEELTNLHRHLGLEGVDEAHINDLRSYMTMVLGFYFESEPVDEVETLPTRLDDVEGGLVLSVAGSERVIGARTVAKAAFGAYYLLDSGSIPPDVWTGVDDELLTRVHLGESSGPSSNDLLRQLNVELQSDDTLLAPRTEMGGLKVVPVSPIDR